MTTTHVRKFYQSVMEDVIQNVREAFLDEGADEQVLQELKQVWESKVMSSKAVESYTSDQEQIMSRIQHHIPQKKKKPQLQPSVGLSTPAAAVVPAFPVGPPPAIQVAPAPPRMVTHLPMFATASPTAVAGLSQAAQAAASALPASFYQQQFTLAGNSIIVQTPHGQFLATAAAPGTLTIPTTRADGSKTIQLDGANDSSSEEDDEEKAQDDDDDDLAEETEEQGEEGEPLNSDDDISNADEDLNEVFDTENVVVCQYDKIHRAKNKWRFQLKDGIMSLNGKDFIFQRATGESDW